MSILQVELLCSSPGSCASFDCAADESCRTILVSDTMDSAPIRMAGRLIATLMRRTDCRSSRTVARRTSSVARGLGMAMLAWTSGPNG